MAKAAESKNELPLDSKVPETPAAETIPATETGVATQAPKPMSLSKEKSSKDLFARPEIKAKFEEMLGKRATSFMASVLQIVAQNKMLINAEPVSVYQAAAVAATLDLPLNQSLGFAYIIPYNQSQGKDKDGNWLPQKQVAQFQIGYKGLIQLLQRTGQCKTVGASPVYEGQIKKADPLYGYEFDFAAKKSDKKIGYASQFTLLNGFSATFYMSTEEVNAHAKRFSKTYGKGVWSTDFDAMACKTVLKLLLGKYAPLSVDVQRAITFDQAVIKDVDTGEVEYVDHEDVSPEEMHEDLTNVFEFNKDKLTPEEITLVKRVLDNKETANYEKVAVLLNNK